MYQGNFKARATFHPQPLLIHHLKNQALRLFFSFDSSPFSSFMARALSIYDFKCFLFKILFLISNR